MRIALDATYSISDEPSGIAVYSREILKGLQTRFPVHRYIHCYRWKQWRKARFAGCLLIPPVPTFRAALFHALNQRVDHRPAARVISTFHDLFVMTADYSSPEYRERFSKQARLAARNSDLIIAVSRFTASQVEDLLHVPSSRIRVVPHGVHQPSAYRATADPPFVLCVGALQKRKNTSALVKAFESLPANWRLVLAGSPSGYGADGIMQVIRDSPASSRIEVTGYVPAPRLNRLYAEASIFAFPSLDEGFGIPVLEAMAYGVPVLSSNGSALKEICQDAAIMVDPYKAEEIASGLLTLAGDEKLRKELSTRGKNRSKQFPWERSVDLTHTVYQDVAG